ncbi:MAG: sugar-binding domain-containing protein, partial [Candidatus Cryptobacteroides sp.]
MKLKTLLSVLARPAAVLAGFCIFSSSLWAQRNDTMLEKGWKFHLGDIETAAIEDFDDSAWESVTVPHDWAIKGPFAIENDLQKVAVTQNFESVATLKTGRTGGLPYMGVGWYRRTIEVPAGKRAELLFDGAMSEARVYVNGQQVCYSPYGYSPFHFDITPYLHEDGRPNTVAVRLENRPFSSRWYPGAGLYRNVHLITTDQVHVPVWGTHVTTPVVKDDFASVHIETEVVAPKGCALKIKTAIYAPDGSVKAEKTFAGKTGEGQPLVQNFLIENPELWSPESPSLYRAVSQIFDGERL